MASVYCAVCEIEIRLPGQFAAMLNSGNVSEEKAHRYKFGWLCNECHKKGKRPKK